MLRTASPALAFEPCIPTQADRPPSGAGWLHEIKMDGFRLIARRDGAGVRLLTRNGHDWTDRYPTIAGSVGRLRCRSCVIDGEVVIVDEHGRAIFERLQNGPQDQAGSHPVRFRPDRARRAGPAPRALADAQEARC